MSTEYYNAKNAALAEANKDATIAMLRKQASDQRVQRRHEIIQSLIKSSPAYAISSTGVISMAAELCAFIERGKAAQEAVDALVQDAFVNGAEKLRKRPKPKLKRRGRPPVAAASETPTKRKYTKRRGVKYGRPAKK